MVRVGERGLSNFFLDGGEGCGGWKRREGRWDVGRDEGGDEGGVGVDTVSERATEVEGLEDGVGVAV